MRDVPQSAILMCEVKHYTIVEVSVMCGQTHIDLDTNIQTTMDNLLFNGFTNYSFKWYFGAFCVHINSSLIFT